MRNKWQGSALGALVLSVLGVVTFKYLGERRADTQLQTRLQVELQQQAQRRMAHVTKFAGPNSAGPKTEPPRRWLPAPTHLRSIVGPNGDELLVPGNLVALHNGELALFDFGAMEIRAFSVDGRQRWRTGRKGSGPGEFRNAMDLKVLPNGDLQVLDMGNRRVTDVSGSGRIIRTIPVRFSSSRFIPLLDTTLVGLTTEDSGAFWSAVNRRGDVVRRGNAPPAIAIQHTLARELFTTRFQNGGAITFRWSDKIAILNAAGEVATLVDGIEPLPFPSIKSYPMKVGKFSGQVSRIDPDAVPGALSVASNESHIFVLFAGATTNRGRIIDVYDNRTGSYVGSELLESAAQELIVLSDGSFATLRNEPIPTIDVWQPVAAQIPMRSAKPSTPSSGKALTAKERGQ